MSRRDTTSTSPATDQKLTQDEWVSVKLNRKIGPVNQTMDSFRKIQAGKTDQELSFIIGQQAAIGMQLNMLNAATLAAAAALSNQSAVHYTVPTSGKLDTDALAAGLGLFGDASSRIVCWVMHSKPYFDVVRSQISDKIFGVADYNVRNGSPLSLGKPILVTDSPSLVKVTGSGSTAVTSYVTLGLTAGGVVLENSEQEEVIVQPVTGNENLSMRLQGEFAYNLGVKGFKWDITSGAANPTDSALGTGTNWDTCRSSFKDFAGIAITSA